MVSAITEVPKKILNKCVDFVPCFKNKKLRELALKIKPYALQVLFFLGAILAGAAIGALFGVLSGTITFFVAVGIGAVTGGLAYFAVFGVKHLIQHYGFPAYSHRTEKPLSYETILSDEKHVVFYHLLDDETKFAKKPWFEEWKKLYNLKSSSEAASYLWKRIQKCVSHGETQGLMRILLLKPDTEGNRLTTMMRIKEIFHFEILEIIRQDFQAKSSTISVPTISDFFSEVHRPFVPVTFNQLELKDKNLFTSKMQGLIDKENAGHAILRLQTAKNRSHAIFIQFSPKCLFYDSYSYHFGGFHEKFKSKDELISSLFHHLQGYYSIFRPFVSRFNQAEIQWVYTDPCAKASGSPNIQ